jgi:hypothetical protein
MAAGGAEPLSGSQRRAAGCTLGRSAGCAARGAEIAAARGATRRAGHYAGIRHDGNAGLPGNMVGKCSVRGTRRESSRFWGVDRPAAGPRSGFRRWRCGVRVPASRRRPRPPPVLGIASSSSRTLTPTPPRSGSGRWPRLRRWDRAARAPRGRRSGAAGGRPSPLQIESLRQSLRQRQSRGRHREKISPNDNNKIRLWRMKKFLSEAHEFAQRPSRVS